MIQQGEDSADTKTTQNKMQFFSFSCTKICKLGNFDDYRIKH